MVKTTVVVKRNKKKAEKEEDVKQESADLHLCNLVAQGLTVAEARKRMGK